MRRIALAVTLALVVVACSGGDDDSATTDAEIADTTPPPTSVIDVTAPAPTTSAPESTAPSTAPATDGLPPADFDTSPGTEQVTITGAEPGDVVELVDEAGATLATGTVDAFGALIFRDLAGGSIVSARNATTRSPVVTVMGRDEHPDPAFYAEQRLPTEGLGYITTRDGTTLSASVWLPGPAGDGPYPTVVEYSGYTPSNPDSAGSSTLFNALGYAYVGVNVRGTGCSGGSFDT
jgi:dipeptidyl aminopeptidase/acylaminoacyl peptidase